MNLGENIYRLRTGKNMSQGDLADALEVSRQSVSKWENNSATPDLEKLIKMSELFEVSLDELVNGAAATREVQSPPTSAVSSARKTAGIILLCFAAFCFVISIILVNPLTGVILALPFLLCGCICFLFQKRVGLWCAWTIFVLSCLFFSLATGTNLSTIRTILRYGLDFSIGAVISIVLNLTMLLLTILTVYSFRRVQITYNRLGFALLACGWIGLLLLHLPLPFPRNDHSIWYYVRNILFELIRNAGFVVLLVFTFHLPRKARK